MWPTVVAKYAENVASVTTKKLIDGFVVVVDL